MKKARRKLSPAQEKKRAEKKEKIRALAQQLKAMPDHDRERLASQVQIRKATDGSFYSVKNQCLIAFQKRDATLCASFDDWKKEGRTVRKGERGLIVFVPTFIKEKAKETDEERESLRGFITGYVFDITQTEAIEKENEKAA